MELDEKLWSQTQISVASWADCDDEDVDEFSAPPAADAGACLSVPARPQRGAPDARGCALQTSTRLWLM